MNKKTVRDIDIRGRKVLARVDFNVPLTDGAITDDTRIRAALPTIRYILDEGGALIVCSHLGRPKGGFEAKYSMKPCAERLSQLLGREVRLASDVVGDSARALAASMVPGDVVMLENVRFEPGEEKNDPELSRRMAGLADVYVNDAFGTAHRAHASTAGVADYLPAVAGFLIEKELSVMGKALADPERPFVAILGGAKIKDKLGVIRNLLDKVDALLIGGAMAYTFEKATGREIGDSLLDPDRIDFCREMMELAHAKGVKLLLPVDNVAAQAFSNDAPRRTVSSIPAGWQGLDIGPETRKLFAEEISKAKTVVWNGPMGVFEFPNFAEGTLAVAQAMAGIRGTTIIGGGDSTAAVEQMGLAGRMTHISTGGGASLEYLEGIVLPGVAALNDK